MLSLQTIQKDDNEDERLLDAGDDHRPVSGHWAGVYT